jgi:hypothetical protein
MNRKYSQEQLLSIMEQAMIYQCACPSLVTRVASDLQHLYDYQLECINNSDTDVEVHQAIAQATTEAYQTIEACLTKILALEGWDLATLQMPAYLVQRQMDELEKGVLPYVCNVPPSPAERLQSKH